MSPDRQVLAAPPSGPPEEGIPLRVLLVDDEPLARERLRQLLGRVGGAVVVGEASTGRAAVEIIERAEPDVVLLDVNLPDLNGLKVLDSLEDPPAVIFCTAYTEYALQAFDLEAADYLLKPFSADRLRRALDRTRRLLSTGRAGQQADGGAAGSPAAVERVAANDGRAVVLTPLERILSFRVEEGVTFLLRDDGERLICEEPIRDLEASLSPRGFFRANRQVLVNLHAVVSYEPVAEGGFKIRLRSGPAEFVSRRRARAFRTLIRAGPGEAR